MDVKVKDIKSGDGWTLINGDSCQVLRKIETGTIGFSCHSPPFASLYTFSDEPEDLGNARDYDEFFVHYSYIAKELFRSTMTGRIAAVHCMDVPTHKNSGEEIGLRDFSGDIIKLYTSSGWIFHSRHCIWKCPLMAATRTKAIGLSHKQIIKDSAMCRMGIPDYLLAFRKPGENPVPISHKHGLTKYSGSREIPRELGKAWTEENTTVNNPNPYDGRKDKRSHWIWQQIASPVWFDIRQTLVLPHRAGKDNDDEKHITPFQLDVVERCLDLWSAPGDTVYDPFSGIGTTVYLATKSGRKGLGSELKSRYHRQAVRNLESLNMKSKSLLRKDNDL